MPKHLLAAHAMELPAASGGQGAAPDWVHLLPIGKFQGRDGRGPYVLRDQAHAASVIAETTRFLGKVDLAGDYDHQLVYSSANGQQAPASGWIKELQARANGIWGRVEWTQAAAARIAAREYRYVSPVFNHRADGTITKLRAFALTNVPNLDLTALASSVFTQTENDEVAMTEEQLKKLREALGLDATATVEQITAHATGLVAKFKAAETSRLAIAKALGADAKATDEQLATAAQGLADKAKGTATDPDPSKFVPMTVFKELQDKVATMSTEMSTDKVATAVADAKADGKLTPAMEDWAKGYASKDLAGFLAWASSAPAIVTPSRNRSTTTGALPPARLNGEGLTEEETAVCAQLGIKPEDFKKARPSTVAA